MQANSGAGAAGSGSPRTPDCGAAIGALDSRARPAYLARLADVEFDVLVIGGGITGAGIAREVAMRGLSVALVDADDFSAGTSSKSTKLIHGGLRYLAMGDVGLVREAARERKSVHAMAPHLAESSWMLLPARSWWDFLKYRFGIAVYEWLGRVAPSESAEVWRGATLHAREPLLRLSSFPRACAYREYLTDDSRLVLAVLRSAAAHGATIINRVKVVGLRRNGQRIVGASVLARDGVREQPIDVRARAVVNATGPWVETVCAFEDAGQPARLHLSKGVHIVLPRARLPLAQVVMINTDDGRILFAIPRDEIVYLGTTDTTYEAGADRWPGVTLADVEYLLRPLNDYFALPEPVRPKDCLGAWAGLRPLIAERGKSAKEISRKDEVWIGGGGMITIAGGKLTGFRKMAEMVLGPIGDALGQPLAGEPQLGVLPGGALKTATDLDANAAAYARDLGLQPGVAARLLRLYGSELEQVVAFGATPLVKDGLLIGGEVDWAVRIESASTLEDVVYRRTRAAFYQRAEVLMALPEICVRMAALLDWDAERLAAELSATRRRLEADLSFLVAAQ